MFPVTQAALATGFKRFSVRRAVLVGAGFVLVAVVVGCGSHRKSARQKASGVQTAGVDVIAANAAHLLHGRRLAVSLGSTTSDIWVLEHGRLVNVSKRTRQGYGADQAAPFSLSPNGTYIAFFLQTIIQGACTTCQPVLYVARSDGSHAHELGANLGFVGFSSVWMPSWDRNGRSFVVAAPKTGIDTNAEPELSEQGDDDTGIFRFEIPSRKETELTPPGVDKYDYAQPVVSPDGREIAFLRSASPEPSGFWQLSYPGIVAYVYVMGANGKPKSRLPLPPRPYADLWWCGNGTVCVDSPTKNLAASANTYRVDLGTGRVTHLRHWAEATYVDSGFFSPAGAFAVEERKTARGVEVIAGPVGAAGVARFAPVLAASLPRRKDPFGEFSVSGP